MPRAKKQEPEERLIHVMSRMVHWSQLRVLGEMTVKVPRECGMGFFPVFDSLEALQAAHPGLPYMTFAVQITPAKNVAKPRKVARKKESNGAKQS